MRAAPEIDLATSVDLTGGSADDGAPRAPRALIVDDEADIRDWLRVELRERGWLVNAARDVAEGIEMALRLRPHLVLLDQHLPDGRGLDAARRIWEEQPEMHLILFSAHLDLATEAAAASMGVQTISKVDHTALFAVVRAHHDALLATAGTG